jgi:hypothetical protein
MKPTKKSKNQIEKEIQEIEKKVSAVCGDAKKRVEVKINENGEIVNAITGEKHFSELGEVVDEPAKKIRTVEIMLGYADDKKSLKKQLKKQGLKFNKDVIYGAELTRKIILSFLNNNLISNKQARKAFEKLHDQVSESVADSNCLDEEKAVKSSVEFK